MTSCSLLQVDIKEKTLNFWKHEGPEEEKEERRTKGQKGGSGRGEGREIIPKQNATYENTYLAFSPFKIRTT